MKRLSQKKRVEGDLEGGLVVLKMLEQHRWSGKDRIGLQRRLWSGIRFSEDKIERAIKLLDEYDGVRISEGTIVRYLVELLPDSRRCCLSMNGLEIKVMLYFKGKYWDVEKFATEAEREQQVRMEYPGITFGKFRGHEAEYAAWHKMCDEVWSEMSARAAGAIRNGTCDVWDAKLKALAYGA
jgi:hypothetical protein